MKLCVFAIVNNRMVGCSILSFVFQISHFVLHPPSAMNRSRSDRKWIGWTDRRMTLASSLCAIARKYALCHQHVGEDVDSISHNVVPIGNTHRLPNPPAKSFTFSSIGCLFLPMEGVVMT